MENLLLFFGRLHPLVVHLPIGILLLLALLELAGRWSRFPRLGEAQRTAVLACGAAAAVMAAGLGWLLAERGDFSGTLLDRHRLLGFLTAGGAIALLVVQGLRWQRVYAPLLALTVGLITAAGHYGGAMVHGEHYLTELLPGKWQRALGVPPSAMAGVRELPLDPATAQVFADVVHPILEQRCVACHGEAKSQGDLRMDSWEAMLLGGKHGALFKPGDVAGSRMIQRMLLPLDHEERMPPKTKPQLSDEELMLIEWWVGSGAPRIGTVAQAAPPPEVADILAERMGAGREEAPRPDRAAVLAQAAALSAQLGIEIRPLSVDAPWLMVSARLQLKQFGDAQLVTLAALGPVIHWLDLGETAVSDAGLAQLSTMSELRRLQLDRTAVTDAGLAALAPLARLESLNLFGTAVTDGGLVALEALPRLRRLHVWQTQVTPAGAQALAKEQTDARRIRRWEEEIAARERMIRAEQFEVTMGETFPAVKVAFPPPGEEKAAP
jgi:uncharacterized membrane protein